MQEDVNAPLVVEVPEVSHSRCVYSPPGWREASTNPSACVSEANSEAGVQQTLHLDLDCLHQFDEGESVVEDLSVAGDGALSDQLYEDSEVWTQLYNHSGNCHSGHAGGKCCRQHCVNCTSRFGNWVRCHM